MPTPDQIAAVLSLGVPGVLAIVVIALVRRIVVTGTELDRVLAERDLAYTRLDRILALFEGATGQKAPK